MLRVLIISLINLILCSCTDIYYKADGKKLRLPSQKKDQIFVSQERLKLDSFDLNIFLHPTIDTGSSIQYMLPSDIRDIAQKTNTLFVIFYYPNCPTAEGYVQLAKDAEDKNIPVLLLSIFNSPENMKKWNDKVGINNRHRYIIPYSETFDAGILTRKIQFMSDLCKSCYASYKDELLYTSFLIIKEKGEIMELCMKDKIYMPEEALAWVEKNIR